MTNSPILSFNSLEMFVFFASVGAWLPSRWVWPHFAVVSMLQPDKFKSLSRTHVFAFWEIFNAVIRHIL